MRKLRVQPVHGHHPRQYRPVHAPQFYGSTATRERSINEHEQILAACRAGDFDRACELLSSHILNAKEYIPPDLTP